MNKPRAVLLNASWGLPTPCTIFEGMPAPYDCTGLNAGNVVPEGGAIGGLRQKISEPEMWMSPELFAKCGVRGKQLPPSPNFMLCATLEPDKMTVSWGALLVHIAQSRHS